MMVERDERLIEAAKLASEWLQSSGHDVLNDFTVDEVIGLLDMQIGQMLDNPEIDVAQARLCVELLRRVPEWAPKIVEQFVGAKGSAARFLERPWATHTREILKVHLATYGSFQDSVTVPPDAATHWVQIGPLQIGDFVRGNLNLVLPILISVPIGEVEATLVMEE